MRLNDLTGQTFGRLTVLRRSENKKQQTMWLCKCSCGKEKIVMASHLTRGLTKSCGCLNSEETAKRHYKHGKRNTAIYAVWCGIKSRCYNPNDSHYKYYGNRGITMCARWRDSFEAFYEDVTTLPHFGEKGYSLDRINNNGNYELGNVRWATFTDQQNNKRNVELLTYEGKTQSLSQWAKELNIPAKKLWSRIHRQHWSVEKAFFTP